MVKTEFKKVDWARNTSSKRKRPCQQADNGLTMEMEVRENNSKRSHDGENINKTLSVRAPKRKKRKKSSQRSFSFDSKKPLRGMTISVSISSDKTKKKNTNNDGNETVPNTYNEVCLVCKELGADVIDLVCKRVDILICSKAAVQQATQRVRKAIKRSKPLVSVNWLVQCRQDGRKIDFEDFRLDKNARDAIQNREDRVRLVEDTLDDVKYEAIPGAGWSEPKDLG